MATTKKKPGKPSDFQGKRLDLLLDFYPTYADASQRGKTRGIWTDFFKKYWAKFPWRLPLTQDPDVNDATDYALKPQNPAEEEDQKKTISGTEQKIKLWLGRQSRASSMKDNPWQEWLTRFRTPSTSAPKKLADYQYYMQRKPYKDKITALYEARKSGVPGTQLMNLRASIARELLACEPQVVRDEMRVGADNEHAALLAKHEDALSGLPALDEEGLAEARTRFSSLIQPLLDGLAAHTGYEVSILAGRVKKTEGKLDIESISLHAGVSSTSPPALDFSRADPRVYGEVMRHYSRFVWTANEFRLGHTTSTPEESPPATDTPTTVPPAPVEESSSSSEASAAALQISATPPAQVAPSNVTIPNPLTTGSISHAPATAPSNTFSDAEIRAHLGLDTQLVPDFDEFDFPEHLMPGLATNPLVLDGTLPAEPNDGFAVPLGPELTMQLDALVGDARTKRMEELRQLDAAALEREKNAARNKYMLNSLGLGDAEKETLWGGTKAVTAPTKRKAQSEGRKEDGKRRRKRRDPVMESDGEEGENGGEDESEDEEDSVPTTSSARAAAKQTMTRPAAVVKKGTQAAASAEILSTGQAFLTQKEYGDVWATLLGVWWKREARVDFVGTGKSHSAKKRPKEVGDWVGRARNHKPKIANAESFGETCERPLSREAGGGWETLDLYGHNAFLNVLMALKWWRDAMSDASPDWEDAVGDVTWALSSMERAVLDSESPPTPTNPPPAEIQPPARTNGSPKPNAEIPEIRELQREEGVGRTVGGYVLSQEELDEMEADSQADLDGNE
ncbi:hypothetical protein R3P38DRAFT_3173036 [Favolaschia claudopus]|uniref:Uncharacterized protein n=1 Tax=Favolaschia claudopus TaxID=2862362 RepID=A0AAW0DJQ8_9AGAR